MKILDSDMLIAILRGDKEAIKKFELIKEEDFIATTIFNVQEILFGAYISTRKENISEAKKLSESLSILEYDKPSMRETVNIMTQLQSKGSHIGLIDEMISGICISNDASIITRNVKHFSKIENLKVEEW